MATTEIEQPVVTSRRSEGRGRPSTSWSQKTVWLLSLTGLVVLLGWGIWFVYGWFAGGADTETNALYAAAEPQRMIITVTEDGNLESASNLEVKCEIGGGSTILSIVEDGKQVQKGDEIIQLNRSSVEDLLNAQRITYNKARATMIQAGEDFAAAEIAVLEFKDGTYHKEMQLAEGQIKIAMENLRSAENILVFTEKMTRKGFATPLQLEADQFGVQRAKLDLDAAQTAKRVLEDYTYKKTLTGLQAAAEAAKARMESEKAAFALEESRLKKLEAQLEKCVIKAPQSGMVVYANESDRRGGGGAQIEEGTAVRENQTLVRLPDLSKMQVKVRVHETKVEQLRIGMPARVRVFDQQFDGRIISIATQPESASWYSANIKEYATIVSINGSPQGLKPGMTAEVEIFVADLPDVLAVPVSAVVAQGDKYYGWVDSGQGREQRNLTIGRTNDKFIEIKDGIKQGERVLLNPSLTDLPARDEEIADADVPPIPKKETAGIAAEGASVSGGPPADVTGANGPDDKGGRGGEKGSGGKGRGAGGSGRGGRSFDLSQLDANKDGKLAKDELPERMQQFFDLIDADKDGYLDKTEMEKAAKMAGGGRRGGDDKSGSGKGPQAGNGPSQGEPGGGGRRRGGPGGGRPGGDGQ